jgi:hypothetical protein
MSQLCKRLDKPRTQAARHRPIVIQLPNRQEKDQMTMVRRVIRRADCFSQARDRRLQTGGTPRLKSRMVGRSSAGAQSSWWMMMSGDGCGCFLRSSGSWPFFRSQTFSFCWSNRMVWTWPRSPGAGMCLDPGEPLTEGITERALEANSMMLTPAHRCLQTNSP